MLALCRERAEREGLAAPRRYAQAVHELDLSRRYRAIVLCGGFGLGGKQEHDVEGLRRLYEHLEPGMLVHDDEVPYADTFMWPRWTREGRAELPRPWREPGTGERGRTARSTRSGLASSRSTRCPGTRRSSCALDVARRRARGRGGAPLEMTLYFTHELRLLLEQAGSPRSSCAPATRIGRPRATTTSSFVARKP